LETLKRSSFHGSLKLLPFRSEPKDTLKKLLLLLLLFFFFFFLFFFFLLWGRDLRKGANYTHFRCFSLCSQC
jgi:hypothetical protein